MKKIPTLFTRVFDDDGHIVRVLDEVPQELKWVLEGEGVATIKWDGAACAIIDGRFYKRYDAKPGRTPPADSIPCCDPDPVTLHWPHWVPVNPSDPGDKWFIAAKTGYDAQRMLRGAPEVDGTFEAIGLHFQRNPYSLSTDTLVPHGDDPVIVERSFKGIRTYLEQNPIEGLVFWKDDEPRCKIKRKDFGLEWPIKKQ